MLRDPATLLVAGVGFREALQGTALGEQYKNGIPTVEGVVKGGLQE